PARLSSRSFPYGSIALQREHQLELAAGPGPAVHLDAPAHVLRVLRGLERTDAHAVALRRLERPEQTLAHERLAHAASRIGHLDDRVPAFGPDPDAHLARGLRGIDGVLHQVSQ